jgi:hypothetical protein
MAEKSLRVAHTSSQSRQHTNRALAVARKAKPIQCVIWYQDENGMTDVLISEGTSRVKAVGALTASAYEVWNRD